MADLITELYALNITDVQRSGESSHRAISGVDSLDSSLFEGIQRFSYTNDIGDCDVVRTVPLLIRSTP